MARIYTGTGTNDYIEVPVKGPSLVPHLASRATALDTWDLTVLLPNPDPVLKKLGRDVAIYKDLLVDPKVGACVENRQAGLLSQKWQIEREDSPANVNDFVTQVFKNLPVTAIMSEILEAPLFGYKPIEISWAKVGSYIVPVAVTGLPQDWFSFDVSNNLRYRSKDRQDGVDLSTPEYRYKFMCPRHRATFDNPYGMALLSRCFWYVAFKKGGMRFWVTMAEKYGMPYLVAKYRQGADDAEKTALLDALEKMIQDACAVIPEGNSVEPLEFTSSGNSAALYEKLLRYCDEQSSMAILGHTGSSASTPGRLGSDDAALEVRKDIVDADKRLVCETFDLLIRWVVEINFGSAVRAPAFGIYSEEQVDKTQAERDRILHEAGVRFTKPYLMRTYGFDEGDIELAADQPAGPQPPLQFAAPASDQVPAGAAQEALDQLVDGLPPELLQEQMNQVLAPVIEFVRKAESLEQIQSRVAELFPKLDTRGIEQVVEKALFLSETWGRINARE